MSELLFPVAAVAATFLLLVPALTIASRAALSSNRRRTPSWAGFGSEATFAWIVAPTLLPAAWLLSSAIHQSEPLRVAESCLIDHAGSAACTDTILLLGLLIAGASALLGARLWREWPRVSLDRLGPEHELVLRVARVVALDDSLRSLRVAVVRGSPEPIYTLGLLRPIVVIDACFLRGADHEIVRAALLHERAHVAGFDTLRGFVARLCLAANPAGALLARDLELWRSAREAGCDGEAVHRGGEPLALAEGIVRAAKFRCGGLAPRGAALCGRGGAALKLRVELLMEGPPAPTRSLGHAALMLGIAAALAAPHVDGLGLLEGFHLGVERLLGSGL